MKISIVKKELSPIVQFLYDMKLKGKQSRHRSRFIKLLKERLVELIQEEKELLIEYAGQDADGEPLRDEKHEFKIEDFKGFRKEQTILINERIVIEGEDHQDMLNTVKNIVFEYNEEISGQEAEVHGYLCEVFEKGEKQ